MEHNFKLINLEYNNDDLILLKILSFFSEYKNGDFSIEIP